MPPYIKEVKRYPFYQDEAAPFPLDLEQSFDSFREKLEELEDSLSELEYKTDDRDRCICPKYYNFRFKYNRKNHGYGAYTTWWSIESDYDDD